MDERRVLDTLLGLYVALLVVPAGALGGWLPATLAVLGAIVGTAVGVAIFVATIRPPAIAARLATLPVAALTILPPLAYLPRLAATTPGSAESFLALAGVSAVLPGIGIPSGGALVRDRRLRAAATEITTVTVGDDDDDDERKLQLLAGVVIVGVALVSVGMPLVLGDSDLGSLVTPLTGILTSAALFANDDTELTVTDSGLGFDQSFIAWDDLDGYRVTDESVELVRSQWYLPTREFDREEIDDAEALIDGLAEFCPRLDDHGRVEMVARRR